MSTTYVMENTNISSNSNSNNNETAPVFAEALAQVPQNAAAYYPEHDGGRSDRKKMVRLSSLLKQSEKKLAEKMAAIAVQVRGGDGDGGGGGGPIQYLHASSMVPETTVIVRDRETGALVGLPAVMGG